MVIGGIHVQQALATASIRGQKEKFKRVVGTWCVALPPITTGYCQKLLLVGDLPLFNTSRDVYERDGSLVAVI